MAPSRISLTLLAALFVSTVFGQEYYFYYYHIIPEEQLTCKYEYVNLPLAADEQTCADACKKCKITSLPSPQERWTVFSVDSSKRNDPCFAYEYYPSEERCEGYVFNIYKEIDEGGVYYIDVYNEYDVPDELGTLCGANHGVDLTPPMQSNSTQGTENYGCRLQPIFDVRTSEEACRAACLTCKSVLQRFQYKRVCVSALVQSNVYGGCAAWFYNLNTEACARMLSVGIPGEDTVCGP